MSNQHSRSQFVEYAKPKSPVTFQLCQLRHVEAAFEKWNPRQNRLVASLPKVDAKKADVLKQGSDFERCRAARQKEEEEARKELIVALLSFVANNAVNNNGLRDLQQRARNQLALLQGKEEEGNKALREGALLNEMLIRKCMQDLAKLKDAEGARMAGVKRSGN